MTRNTARWGKGTVVSAVAAVVCYAGWSVGADWSQALLVGCAGVLAMPLLLWAGMRLLGERGTRVLALVGGAAWWLIGTHMVEGTRIDDTDTALLLAVFALLGGVLCLARPSTEG
ncbi:hypothetical protein [Streptomyces sp. YU58]|uniref:hypothetical protein n=1 Tax=Streptomyces sp. SX92 TaxID=3158972 RepID=UPI0027BAAA56|nr:hypothetical protein [Streptomyces coralus]WLW52562.1 hypothetical protein QU709_14735 [Streptomyces coralus]